MEFPLLRSMDDAARSTDTPINLMIRSLRSGRLLISRPLTAGYKLRSVLLGLLATWFVAGLAALPARADTIYTYTGNAFNSFVGFTCPPECMITGSFTVAQPLAANLSNFSFTPLSFSFTDGNLTLTPANAFFSGFTSFSTDASGAVTAWAVIMSASGCSSPPGCGGGPQLATVSILSPPFALDQSNGVFANAFAAAAVGNDPGAWVAATPVPESSSLFLLGTGLLGIVAWSAVQRKWLRIAATKPLHPSTG